MTELHQAVAEAFNALRPRVIRPAEGFLKYDYLVPGGYYVELWDWDGFFIGVHLATRGPEQAGHLRNWVRNFVAAGDDDGYAPGCVTSAGPEPGHRSFQMKPFIAQGAAIASREAGDVEWLEPIFDDVIRMATRRERTHRDANTGLFFWDNAMQSGADDNPALTNDPDDVGAILACDINAFQQAEYRALAWLAEGLGREEEAERFDESADALADAFLHHHWCQADGTCWNIRRDTGEFVKRVSYSNFIPLVYNLLPEEAAASMVERYLWSTEHMRGDFGLRTLSRQDAEYNNENIIWPYSNWRGPVWPISNYLYFRGLMSNGFRDEAAQLADTIGRLCLEDIERCGAMHENYDADTGAPLAPSGDQSPKGFHEGGFIGWNLLVQNMFEELEGAEDPLAV